MPMPDASTDVSRREQAMYNDVIIREAYTKEGMNLQQDPVMLMNALRFSHEVYDSPVPILTRVDAFFKMIDIKKDGNDRLKSTKMKAK